MEFMLGIAAGVGLCAFAGIIAPFFPAKTSRSGK